MKGHSWESSGARAATARTAGYAPTVQSGLEQLGSPPEVCSECVARGRHAIGAGTHDHDPERQYFYVLLELKIAVESYKYFAYAVRAA
jgi:hypothetical protein